MTKIKPRICNQDREERELPDKEGGIKYAIHRSECCLWKSSKSMDGVGSHSILLKGNADSQKKKTFPWKREADGIRKKNYKTIAVENLNHWKIYYLIW